MSEARERQFDYGPQRASWTFPITVGTLRAAVARKRTHHRARHAYWTKELTKAETELKKSVQIREHQVTGGSQHTTVFDQEKSNYVNLCKQKRDKHYGLLERFDAWAGLLKGQDGEVRRHLTVDDAEYFGLTAGEERA